MIEGNERAPAPSRTMTINDFAQWGREDVAYVKRAVVNGQLGWSIHAADGTAIGFAPERDLAMAAIVQNELEAQSVH